jgi:hypothetical protein
VPLRAVPELPAGHRNQAYPARPDYTERADGSENLVNREGYPDRQGYSARRDYPRDGENPAPAVDPEESELIPGLRRGPSGDDGRPAGRGRHAGGAAGSVTAEPGRR